MPSWRSTLPKRRGLWPLKGANARTLGFRQPVAATTAWRARQPGHRADPPETQRGRLPLPLSASTFAISASTLPSRRPPVSPACSSIRASAAASCAVAVRLAGHAYGVELVDPRLLEPDQALAVRGQLGLVSDKSAPPRARAALRERGQPVGNRRNSADALPLSPALNGRCQSRLNQTRACPSIRD